MNLADFISLSLIRKLELLADDNNCVLWIRNENYNEQLYLSSNYNKLWGRECASLYRKPESWYEALDDEYTESLAKELKKNRTLINPEHTAIYRIKLPNGEKHCFQDRSIHLQLSSTNQHIIIGVALWIVDEEMIDKNQPEISDQLDHVIAKFYQALVLEKTVGQNEKPVECNDIETLKNLTRREKQIYMLFLRGHTMIQVSNIIHISPRTVEGHLNKLKEKLACESKSELIMKAIENRWLLVNIE